ncbi:MAG: Si-specific NAD(P)(+) transhydrogenase [Planctomycetota bacterium]
MSKHYDILVIGTGPAGQKGAIQAAKLGRKVGIIEKSPVVGGVQVNTGTIPSKSLREAVVTLTGADKRNLFGASYRAKKDVTIADLAGFSQQIIRHEWELIGSQFERNHIDLIWGHAQFVGPNEVEIETKDGPERITADKFLVSVGTRPAKPDHIPFNDHNILTSDELLHLDRIPKTMIVVGGGVIGSEYACIMATLGVRVTLVEGRHQVLGFLDQEIAGTFQYFMRQKGITLRLGEKVECIEEIAADTPTPSGSSTRVGDTETVVQAQLESGKTLRAEVLLYSVGRQGVCGALGLDAVGIEFDDRERLKVNDHYQTNVEHVYAAGDVIGFPALASTSMEQGRRAICHACGVGDTRDYNTELFPFGIYAVPEISMIGKTEEQLTDEGIPYEAGIAHYREISRAKLLGDELGMMKLLIHQETHEILGIHVIGAEATELIHVGQAVMVLGGKAEFFIDNVFNYPTLAECYRVATYNGLNKLNHV